MSKTAVEIFKELFDEKENKKTDALNDDDDDYGDIEQACLCVHIRIQSWHNTLYPVKQFNSSTAWNFLFSSLPLMTCILG